MGEGLRVADERRAAPDSLLERPRGSEGGLRRPPVEVADERRLLAGDVVTRHAREAQRRRCIGELAPFGDRLRGGLRAGAGGVAHAHDHFLGVDRRRGQLAAIEHQMRKRAHQRAILPARGLALGGVDHDHRAPARARDRAQLVRRRKRAATAAAEAGVLELPDQLRLPAPAAGQLRRRLTVECEVLCQAHRPVRRDAREHARQRLRRARGERRAGCLHAGAHCLLTVLERWLVCASSEEGVPERRAQLEPSGPPGSHASSNSEKPPAQASAAARTRRF